MTVKQGHALDPDRLAALYDEHRIPLVRLALLLVDDLPTAEDVVHDAFARALGREVHPEAALGYVRTAVVNGARSTLRRRRTARDYVAPIGLAADPADAAVLADEHREVLAALHRLPRRQREVLVLRYYAGLSEAEIATTTGISRGAVKSTAHRALAALERALATEEAVR